MNRKKQLKYLLGAVLLPLAFTACDDDGNPGGDNQPFRAESGIYVFNTGTEGYGIEGSLSYLDPATRSLRNSVFLGTNGRSLGSTVQDGVILGEEMYIAVSGSNTVEVVDKHTAQSIAQILTNPDLGGPRDIVTDGEYVYVSMFGGYVARIDPATHTVDRTVPVGPNPEEMVVLDGYLYVANSDGLNYANGYVDGKSVSQVSLDDFAEEKKIGVGMNPSKVAAHAASGKLFVACMGDYADNPPSIWTIDTATGEATDLQVPATLICLSGNTLYTIYNNWSGAENMPYVAYDARTNAVLDEAFIPVVSSSHGFEYNRVDNPAGIVVNPADGHIFVASYAADPVNAYSLPSYVYEYDAEGQVLCGYDVGVGAVNMLVLE